MPKRKLLPDTSNHNRIHSHNGGSSSSQQFADAGTDAESTKDFDGDHGRPHTIQPRGPTRPAAKGGSNTPQGLKPAADDLYQSSGASGAAGPTGHSSVKLEILPNADPKKAPQSSASAFSNTPKMKVSTNPPKVIMLPDSMQSTSSQKRRRVVRACDRCRKLKIKCSGDLPCIHCTVYSYECTYDQPNRSKRKGPSSVAVPATVKTVPHAHAHPHGNASMATGAHTAATSTSASTPSMHGAPSVSAGLADRSPPPGNMKKNSNDASMERFNSSTVSILASSNPELFSKLTDRLKLYDDILHRLLPEIKLTDLNDNPKPINPMKLMSALNKLKGMGKSISKSSSKHIAKMYESLPEMPLPNLPITKLPPNSSTNRQASTSSIASPPLVKPKAVSISSNTHIQGLDTNNSQYQGIDGSLESTLGKEIKIILPSREVALDLITKTWENACVLFRFYHRVAFVEDLNELYDTDPNQYTNKQQRFLPLVYSVMACGALFYKSDENTNHSRLDSNTQNSDTNSNDGNSNANTPGSLHYDYIQRKDFEDEGYRYFIAARKLIDITDTRDTYGIQTIVMLIIFLQCSARLSTCYAYIGIALRAALREGLHRKLDYPFNPIELEIRKRLFWTIYKMDIYVNTMLGLPRTISSDDFDQDMPIELDDENITVSGYRWDRQGDRLSSAGIANAHTRLIFLMKEVVTKLYPIKPKKVSTVNNGNHNRANSNHSNANNTNNIVNHDNGSNTNNSNNDNTSDGNNNNANSNNNSKNIGNNGNSNNNHNSDDHNNSNNNRSDLIRNNFVYDLELKLQDWMNSLPLELKPGVEPPGQYLKANRLLHISYLHVKIILYRPFIHYISTNVRSNSLNDLTCIEKAKNCINVARIVVKLAEDMINKNMLSGSYWFSIYTIFFSVACLVYYVHFAPPINRDGQPDLEYIAIKKDAENGKRVLDILKDSSMAARRTYNILNALFEQLNRKTARAGVNNSPQFVPAHAGTPEYTKQRQQQQQKQQQKQSHQQQQYTRHQHQYSNTSQPESVESQYNMGNTNVGSLQDPSYTDVNSGIDLAANNDGYQRFGGSTSNGSLRSPQMQTPVQVPRQMNMQPQAAPAQGNRGTNAKGNANAGAILQHTGSRFNAPARNQHQYPSESITGGRQQQEEAPMLPFQNFDGQTPSDKSPNNRAPDLANAVFNDITEYKYVPGPMDQMDMKIFGRFLPPYMLNNKAGNATVSTDQGTDGAGEAGRDPNMGNPSSVISPGDLDSLSQGNAGGGRGHKRGSANASINAAALNDVGDGEMERDLKNAQQEGGVFQPSLGLFTFVKDNEESDFDKDSDAAAAAAAATAAATDMGNADGSSRVGEGGGYSDGNWIDNDLLETTNDFFNQVTTANAIPSGLSTIFQSESDKNGAGNANGSNGGAVFDDPGSGVASGGENTFEGSSGIAYAGLGGPGASGAAGAPGADERGQRRSTIELPSRFTSIGGIGMLDELLFGSGWDNANARASDSASASASNTKNSSGDELGRDTSDGELDPK